MEKVEEFFIEHTIGAEEKNSPGNNERETNQQDTASGDDQQT
jgi:hypothetical protein